MNRFILIALTSSLLLLLIDSYVFKGLRLLLANLETSWLKRLITYGYWATTLLFIAYMVWIASQAKTMQDEHNFKHFYNAFGIFVLLFVPKLIFAIFHLMDDISFVFQWLWSKVSFTNSTTEGEKITRAAFLTRIGLVLAAVPFMGILYGILKGKYDFRILKHTIPSSRLPKAFQGFKVVQISDAHLGSFLENKAPVEKAIKMINDLNADIVVFTGDLVNNYADEAEFWIPFFRQIKGKYGKFSILGNHDYSDYVPWTDKNLKRQNLDRLKAIHAEMGFDLLLNSNRLIQHNGAEILLVGVENWGKPPFPQYGDLALALQGANTDLFTILLSHDPSHWDLKVLPESLVDLTLSGHTHGMQFGIEIAGIKWSPVKYKYPRWGGIYKVNGRYLNVNRGFGFLGFPGRVGMPPEITQLELAQA